MGEKIPEVRLDSGSRTMPVMGMGTADFPFAPDNTRRAIFQAIEVGYRHFDTAALYQSEAPLGEAISEAVRVGILKSREELFITSKLWCNDAHPDLVLPALEKSLRALQLDYLDLYLIHFPVSCKPAEECPYPLKSEDLLALDLKPVWEAMEKCHKLGLVRSIGISNFPRKKIEELLLIATVAPTVNQVEMNPVWQQKKLREFCMKKNIHVTAYSPLGGQDHSMSKNLVMESQVLKEIARARGKTVAQVSLRWLYEQGVSMVVKSFNKERMEANLRIFDWELSDEECHRISEIPQCRKFSFGSIVSGEVDLNSLNIGFSDEEI